MFFRNILFTFLSLLLFSCQSNKTGSYDLIITNTRIIDIASGKTSENRLIAISGDTIKAVDKMENIGNYKSSKIIDAHNNFAMPGLWDMHVHFRGGDTLIQENKNLLPLYLSYGVTTIRDCGGDISKSVLRWKSQIAKGELDGPSIFSSGPKLDGSKPAWPGSLPVVSEADVQKALDSLQSLDVDFVKIYDGSLTPTMFYKIIKAAEDRGMLTTGHMPMAANLMEAVDDGLDGSEHMYYIIKSCSPEADSLTKLNLGYGMVNELVNSYDPELAEKVFKKMKQNHVSLTPTLHIGTTLAEILDKDHTKDSLLPYIGKGIQKTYNGRIEGAKRAKAAGRSNMYGGIEELSAKMMVPMYKAGMNLLAGSDAGAYNSFVYPGESLIDELHSFVNAGLTPQQALETATINGPKFFGIEKSYGSIAKGKVADVILLQKNPLEDISNISTLTTVIKDTLVYDQQKLHQLLKEVRN